MDIRPIALLAPVLGLVLAFIAPDQPREMAKKRRGRGAAAATVASPFGAWNDPARLATHMEAADDWAGEALKRGKTRLPFLTPVTAIASNPADAARVIEKDWAQALATMGAKDPASKVALAHAIAGHVLAVYDPDSGTVHVLPENVKRAAQAAGQTGMPTEAVLRLLLVRMGLVALTRQHVPEWKQALDAAPDLDALHCAAAVFQGRVQYQTRRVNETMNRQDPGYSMENFDQLTALLTAPAADDAKPGLRAFVEAAKFAVVQGGAFMTNIPNSYHRDVLKSPPTKRSVIFDPKTYREELRSESKRGPVKKLPTKVHATFQEALMAEGDWQHAQADFDREGLEGLVAPVEKRFTATQMAAFRGGWHLTSAPAEGADGPTTDVFVLEMRSEGQAEALLGLLRGAAKQRGGTLEDGAGRDLGLNGFHGSDKVEDTTYHVQWVAEGRFVVGYRTTQDLSDEDARLAWDEVMEGVAEDVSKVAGSRDSRRRRKGR